MHHENQGTNLNIDYHRSRSVPVVPTNIVCVTYSAVIIVIGLSMLTFGFIFRNHERRVVEVNQLLFFWIGRDRVVLDIGRTFMILGGVIIGIGLMGFYIGWTVMNPY